MDFWTDNADAWWAQDFKPAKRARAAVERPASQNDTRGVCEFCGFASDDVLLGVCADCAPED